MRTVARGPILLQGGDGGNVMPVVICQTGDVIGVCWPNTEWDTTEGTVRPRSLVSTLTISLSHSSNQRLLEEICHLDNTHEGALSPSPPINYLIAAIGPGICLFCAEKIFKYLDIFRLESIDFCGIQLMKELYWHDKPLLSLSWLALPSLRPGEEIQWQGYKKLNVWPLTIELNRILLKYNSSRMWGIIELY